MGMTLSKIQKVYKKKGFLKTFTINCAHAKKFKRDPGLNPT